MINKILSVIILVSFLSACKENDTFIRELPEEPEAIADMIAATPLFMETAAILKEMSFKMLSAVHDGADEFTQAELTMLDTDDENLEELLVSKNFKNAHELAELKIKSNVLRRKMVAELTQIKFEIGDDKFSKVDAFISSKYGHLYKVSFDQALTLVNKKQ